MPVLYATKDISRPDFTEIKSKISIENYCRQRGIVLEQAGRYLRGKCPVHHEHNGQAFIVDPAAGRAYCNGKCQGQYAKGWDVIDLEAALSGSSTVEAAKRLRDTLPDYVRIESVIIAAPVVREDLKPTKQNPFALAYIPTKPELARMNGYSRRLLEPGAVERFLEKPEWSKRQWKPETIKSLALDGYLGVYEEATTFHYASCCKARWIASGKREIRFRFGKPWLWRGELIPDAATVVMVEGEPDVITLIDAGMELERVAVVGLPAAGFSVAPWSSLFINKSVVIIPDNDEPGRDAAAKIKSDLTGSARTIQITTLNEII